MTKSHFEDQVELMLDCLTQIFPSDVFALKGGTAINFFFRNMPRLSVDIDLTYLPLTDRRSSIKRIEEELKVIAKNIEHNIKHSKVFLKTNKHQMTHKMIVSRDHTNIKIEPNFVLRGAVHPVQSREPCERVEEQFGFSYEVSVLSFEDLYGGKICAALDRQHPRDLFDIKLLFENEGLTTKLRQSFIAYLLSHNRPINEIITPTLKDISSVHETEFKGMTLEKVSLRSLTDSRNELISSIHKALTNDEKKFILSFKDGNPDWTLFPIDIQSLPALKWKLLNIQTLKKKNPLKHTELYQILKAKLSQ